MGFLLGYLPTLNNKVNAVQLIYIRSGCRIVILPEKKWLSSANPVYRLIREKTGPNFKIRSEFIFGPNLVFGPNLSLVWIVVQYSFLRLLRFQMEKNVRSETSSMKEYGFEFQEGIILVETYRRFQFEIEIELLASPKLTESHIAPFVGIS